MCDEDSFKEEAKIVMFPQEDHFNSLFEAFVAMCNRDLGPIDPDWYARGTAAQLALRNRARNSLSVDDSESSVQPASSESSNRSTPSRSSNDEVNITDTLCQTAFWSPCTQKNESEGDIFKTPAPPENDIRRSLGADESGPGTLWSPSLQTPPHVRLRDKTGRKQIAPKTLFGDAGEKNDHTDCRQDSVNEEDLEDLDFGIGMETETLSFCNEAEATVLGCKIDFESDDGEMELEKCLSANAVCVETETEDAGIKNESVAKDVDEAKCSDGATEVETTEKTRKQDELSHEDHVVPKQSEDNIHKPLVRLSSDVGTANVQSESKPKLSQHDGEIVTAAVDRDESSLSSTQIKEDVASAVENDEENMDVSFAKSQNDFLRGGYSLTQILEAAESTAACMDAPDFTFTQTESSSEDLLADWYERPVAAHAATNKLGRIGSFAASSPVVPTRSSSTPCNVSRVSKRKTSNVFPGAGDFGVVSPINGPVCKEKLQANETSSKAQTVFTGFTTGTGNIVSVTAKSLNVARRLLSSVDGAIIEGFEENEKHPPDGSKATNGTDRKTWERNKGAAPTDREANFVSTGFSTAGGKSIRVSAMALTSAKKLLADAKSSLWDEPKRAKRSDEVVAVSNDDADVQRFKTAFTTGSGKAVSVSKTALSSARQIFSTDETSSLGVGLLATKNTSLLEHVEGGNGAGIVANGSPFCVTPASSAIRGTVVSGTCREGAGTTCNASESSAKEEFLMDPPKSLTGREDSLQTAKGDRVDTRNARDIERLGSVKTFFTTGSGKAVTVSADSLKNAGSLLRDDKVVTGFTTGSGKQVHVSKGSLKTAETLLSESKCLSSPDENRNISRTLPGCGRGQSDEKVATGFSTGNGMAVTISKSALASAQSYLNSMIDAEDDKNECRNMRRLRKEDFMNKRDLNSTDHSRTEKTADKDASFEERMKDDSASNRKGQQTPLTTSVVTNTTEQRRTPQIQRMFTSKIKPQAGVRSSVTPFKAVLKATPRGSSSLPPVPAVNSSKKNAIQPGKLWILRKLQKLPRISMRHTCGNPRLQPYSLEELENFGVSQQTALITSESAADHRFHLPQSDELVIMGDGIILGPHSGLQLGREELYEKFVKMPGVEPSLVCKKWFTNHYRWVVWKLAAMERRFPQVFGGRALTPDQVMLQIKYRYDIEIDNSSRPALRKIVEQDDIPSKTMVLCVSGVKRQDDAVSLEVTDGWYEVKAELDEPLSKMVADGRIFCGQKLITSCAELVGSASACSPLEIPDETALKINFNTTRRARWDARLGYFRSPQPFPVPLASLHPKGGPAGRVDCVVIRTYPLLYLERLPNGTSVMRSERSERQVAAEHEKIRAEYAERLMAEALSQVQKADGESIQLRGVKSVHTAFSVQQVRGLSSGRDIWKALQCCGDASEIECLLSEDQIRMLREYQEQCYNRKQVAVEERFHQALQAAEDEGKCPKERTVVPVLKVLLGGLHEKDLQKSVCCIASIWRPFPELQEMLTEGKAVSFYNVGVCPVRNVLPDVCNSAVELTTLKHTKYETVDCPDHVRIYYERQVTSFPLLQSQRHGPQSRAIDVVGVVFLLHHGKETDVVFLADPCFNFVQVTIHGGCNALTAEGRINIRQVIAATDLLLAKPKQQDYKNTVALATTELSEISPSPRRPHLRDAVASLRAQAPDIDLLAASALQQFNAAQRRQSTRPVTPTVRKVGATPVSRVYAAQNTSLNASYKAVYRPGMAYASPRETNSSVTEAAPKSTGGSSPSLTAMYDGLFLPNSKSVEPGSPAEARSKQIKARIALLQRYGALAPLPPLTSPESVCAKRPYRTPVRRKPEENSPMEEG